MAVPDYQSIMLSLLKLCRRARRAKASPPSLEMSAVCGYRIGSESWVLTAVSVYLIFVPSTMVGRIPGILWLGFNIWLLYRHSRNRNELERNLEACKRERDRRREALAVQGQSGC